MTVGAAAILLVACATRTAAEWRRAEARVPDFSNSPFFAEAHRSQEMLLVAADLQLIQLRTRRPLLLTPLLNGLPYAPESGPETERILPPVYGVDLLHPPREITQAVQFEHFPALAFASVSRPVWEARTVQQWRELATKFGFRDILTGTGWRLQLPITAENEEYVLFHVPE